LFPDGGRAGIGDGCRHGIDQRERSLRRADGTAFLEQIASVKQPFDDAGARRLCANPGRVLQLLF
jgi:hypothetical protein